jgi:hypothetical protein
MYCTHQGLPSTQPYYFQADLIWWDGTFKPVIASKPALFQVLKMNEEWGRPFRRMNLAGDREGQLHCMNCFCWISEPQFAKPFIFIGWLLSIPRTGRKKNPQLIYNKGSVQWKDLVVESKLKRKVMVWGPGAEQWILFIIYRDAILDSISYIFLSLKQKMLALDKIVCVANCKQRRLFFVLLSCSAD